MSAKKPARGVRPVVGSPAASCLGYKMLIEISRRFDLNGADHEDSPA
jgi:hypothetical protein